MAALNRDETATLLRIVELLRKIENDGAALTPLTAGRMADQIRTIVAMKGNYPS